MLSACPYDAEPALVSEILADASTSGPVAVPQSDLGAEPLAGSTSPGGFTPDEIRHAYGFDQVFFAGGSIVGDGAGQTIAIVSAFNNDQIAHDLVEFSNYFDLAVPTISPDLASFLSPSNPGDPPRFVRVTQTGGVPSSGAASDPDWSLETALDVEWVHAIAPGANILLVQATSNLWSSMFAAVNWARAQSSVSVVSLSWGALEFSGETGYDANFLAPTNHSGLVVAAAAGNTGSPGMYPAYSPNVLAVGATTLSLDGLGNYGSETTWGDDGNGRSGGGGLSVYEPQPSFQSASGLVTQSTTQRASPDVAFNANPSTGVPVYDSKNNGTSAPWTQVGGTSFATPAWAALVVIANQGRAVAGLPVLEATDLMSKLYTMPASNFHDITSGTTGGATPQAATLGYDLTTGRGSPKADLIVPYLVGTASIAGTVFNDVNGNGTLDGEPGLVGWTVYSDLNNNGAFDPIAVTTFNSTDADKPIPVLGTITSDNVVSGLAGNIIDVNVTLDISHNSVGQLQLTLISPTGTRITLADHLGGFGNNYTNTTFDDSAAVPITRTNPAFTGSFSPTEPLSALYGTSANGTWQLEVDDTVSTAQAGRLNSWSLDFDTGDPSTTSDVNGAYSLDNVQPGTHRVRQILQSTYVQTGPVGGFYTINVGIGGSVTTQDFGNWIPPSTAPGGVSLLAASDTGISDSDRVTKLNNGSPLDVLAFDVTGTIVGATITLFADGTPIGSAVATGTVTTVTTDGSTVLADGARSITAQQTEPGKATSLDSPAVSITVDTTAPGASIVAVSPDPHVPPVPAITINFSEAVSGVDLADFELARDGGGNLLTGAQTVTTVDDIAWTLGNLSVLTGAAGFYELALVPAGVPPIADLAGNLYSGTATTSFTVLASIVGRHLFYNESGTSGSIVRYDGKDSAINALDDNAIASDKTAYLPGTGTASFANISSYSKGINGIMIDIAGPHGAISADDFIFLVGNNNTPSAWTTAPAPASISVRAGAGTNGSDRVTIIWNNGDVKKQWLEVITLANGDTGLGQHADLDTGFADVFFFGNALGNSGAGDLATLATVDITDELGARNNPTALPSNIPITNIYDYNRDAKVDITDNLIARNNITNAQTGTRYLNLAGAAAPESDPAPPDPGAGPSVSASAEVFESPNASMNVGPAANDFVGPTAAPAAESTSRVPGFAGPSRPFPSLALAAAAAERHHAARFGMPVDFLSFVDEQLLELLAVGRMQPALRPRR